MRASSVIASVAALASFAGANNVTDEWGNWSVTNLTESIPPSASHHVFSFYVQYYAQSTVILCRNYDGYGNLGAFCDDSSLTFTLDNPYTELCLSQKLYQTGSIVTLNGSTPLSLSCETIPTGSTLCSSADFLVNVTSESVQLPSKLAA